MRMHPVPEAETAGLYCGPTAIASITGLPVGEVLRAAHRYMRRPHSLPIVGMTDVQLTGALALLGYASYIDRWRNTKHGGLPNLGQWVRSVDEFKGAVILSLSKHYCVCTYDEYLCNQTKGQPVPITDAPNMRARVNCVINVRPL